MDFGEALKAMKRGKRVRRSGWNGKGIFISIIFGESYEEASRNTNMTHDYICIDTTGLKTDNEYSPKDRVPWVASQTDMLADDWKLVETQAEQTKRVIKRMRDSSRKAQKKLITNSTINVKINVDDDSLKAAAKKIDEHSSMSCQPDSMVYLKLSDAEHVRGVAIPFKTNCPDQIKEVQDVLQQNIDGGLISIN